MSLYKNPRSLAAAAAICVVVFLPFRDERPVGAGEREMPSREWFWRQRSYPFWTIPLDQRRESLLQARNAAAVLRPAASAVWQQRGPTNVGGRITAMGISQQNPSILYAGAAEGGVLKSTDAGVHWLPLFDDQLSLSIGALAVDPRNDNVVYVGTGEANSSGDSYDGFGMVKSTDGGVTWFASGLGTTRHIGQIVLDPRKPDIVYAAAMGALFSGDPDRGLYKSTDAGASWAQILFVNDSTGVIDVAITPQSPDTLYAAAWQRKRGPQGRLYVGGPGTGIYRTFDAGAHWTLLSNGLPAPGPTVGRPGIAVAPTDPQTAYVSYSDDPGNFAGVYRTTDGGDSWNRTNDAVLGSASLYNNYGWYFGRIVVSPTNASHVFVLGVELGESSDGGASWTVNGLLPHVDLHAMVFDPLNPNVVYLGNDGGRGKSTDGGRTWFDEPQPDLPITQFYAGCIDNVNPSLSMGGTQDNGTPRTLTGNAGDWGDVTGGDGFYCAIDYTNDNYQYGELYYAFIISTPDNWQTSFLATNGIDMSDRANWSSPLIMDPHNPAVLYMGTQRIYKTANRAQSWTAISGDLSNGLVSGFPAYATVTTIDVSAADSNAILAGTDDANAWITTDGGAHWTNVSAGLPNRWITRVRFDPSVRSTAYLTCSGYRTDSPLPHVFRTTDLGSHWQDISGNLPEAPVNVILVDPQFTNRLYVGTDVGPWYTTNGGTTWSIMGSGFPNVVIDDMALNEPMRIARAFTHGRSMWEINLDQLVSGVGAEKPATPAAIALLQNYPNPFNPATTIEYTIGGVAAPARTTESGQVRSGGLSGASLSGVEGRASMPVKLVVYDILGREVATLVNERKTPGTYEVSFNGAGLASGIYVYRLTAGSFTETRQMALIK